MKHFSPDWLCRAWLARSASCACTSTRLISELHQPKVPGKLQELSPASSIWDFNLLARALSAPLPADINTGPERQAAIALIFRQTAADHELLVIHRAVREGDPWSSHLAFPGGHREPEDPDLLSTAIRETWEETGIDLRSKAELLGPMAPASPYRAHELRVYPYVFALKAPAELSLSREVQRALWVAMSPLLSGALAAHYELFTDNRRLRYPGFRVEEHVLWGLSYRVLRKLLDRVQELSAEPLSPRWSGGER